MKQFEKQLIFTYVVTMRKSFAIYTENVLLFTIQSKSIFGGISDFGDEASKCVS